MKTLILAVDIGKAKKDDVEVRAMQMQLSDYFRMNKTILGTENIIIFPIAGEMKLFWLEGDLENPKDIKDLEEIKDRIRPVLETSLGIRNHAGIKKPKKKPKK